MDGTETRTEPDAVSEFATVGVEIGILGPLRIAHDGEERLGRGGVHRILLSMLASEPRRRLDVDELLDALCCVRPDRAWTRQNVYSAVSRLQRELPGVVVGRRGAYSLDPSTCVVDMERFESLALEARQDLVGGNARAAVGALREALGLWRGVALAEWRTHPRAEAIGARLDEVRLGAEEDLGRALLAAGEPRDAVGVCRELLTSHPEREHAWASLLKAFDALGSTEEVWRTYDEARRLLAEAGLEPGVELEQLMRRIGSGAAFDQASPVRIRAGTSLHPLVRLATERPIIGRAAELATLEQLAGPALDGNGTRLVLVDGTAGVGKTRLAAEVAARCFERGATVWFGIAEDRLEAPYGPLLGWVRGLIDDLEEAERAQIMNGPLGQVTSADGQRDASGLGPARWSFFEAVADLVCRTTPAGAVVVVDDVQHLPSEGIDLIRHLLVSRPDCRLLVVATRRDEPLSGARDDTTWPLRRLPMTASLRLEELTPEVAVELLAGLSGSLFAAAEQRARLTELTHGNPLLIATVANDPDLLDHIDTGQAISGFGPRSVEQLVAGFLSRLDTPSMAVLEAAAVVGRVFDCRVLWAMHSGDAPFDAIVVNQTLATTTRAGWVEKDSAEPHRFTFVHEMVRLGIYDTASEDLRARLHWAVGKALAALGIAEGQPDLLAHHYLAAWPACPTGEVVHHVRAAAQQAAELWAVEQADRLFDAALAVAARDPARVDDRIRYELLMLAGPNRADAGRPREAAALLQDAVRIAQRHGWERELALAVVGLADNCGVQALPDGASGLLQNAAQHVPELQTEVLYLLHLVDDGAAEHVERNILEVAASSGDAATAGAVLGAMWRSSLGPRRVEVATDLCRLGDSAGDPGWSALGLLHRWIARLAIGDTTFDDDVAGRIESQASAPTVAPLIKWYWHVWQALVATHHAGDFAAADSHLDGARAVTFAPDDDNQWFHTRMARMGLAYKLIGAVIADLRGELARYRALQEEAMSVSWRLSIDHRALRAALLARVGDLDTAARLCAEVLDDGLLHRPPNPDWLVQLVHLGQAYTALGDADGARALIPPLTRYRHHHVLLGMTAYYGSVEHYLGLIHGVTGDWDAAVTASEAAFDAHERVKTMTMNVATGHQLAWALERRGRAGDDSHALTVEVGTQALAAAIGVAAPTGDPWATLGNQR